MKNFFSHYANAFATKLEKIIADDLLLSVALLFLPIIYMLAALSLITDIGLGRWVLPAGLLLWATAVVALHREEKWQKIATKLLLFLVAFALIALVSSKVLDINWDSRGYHYLAVQALLDGVNPFYEPLKWEKLTIAYPIAYWILSASLVLWTSSIEASCALTSPAILTAFICSWRFIATFTEINKTWRMFLALLFAANPIVIWTLFTHHVDGMLVSVLLSSFMLILTFVANGKNSKQKDKSAKSVSTRRQYVYITASLILLINVKLTGLAFGAILGLTALVYGIAINGNTKQTWKRILKLIKIGTIVPIIAVLFFGFFPYVTNTIHHKTPFYPTAIYDEQGNKVDSIFRHLFEPNFFNRSNYEKWWISLFTKQEENWVYSSPLPPFAPARHFSVIYGFGSFFSGAMLLCLTLVLFIRNKAAWIIISGIFVSILMTEVAFMSRLTPQTWWIPILILVFFLAKDGKVKNKIIPIPKVANIMAAVVTACLLYSSITYFGYYAFRHARIVNKVAEFRKQGGWYVTSSGILSPIKEDAFFKYYDSGLTGVGLPTLEKCPEGAQKIFMLNGLVLCRP